MTSRQVKICVLAACTALSTATQAALYDRGGGLIYDDVLDLTWLQDANFSKSSGFDGDGRMNWSQAMAWAAGLSYHDSVRNVDWTGWRLPRTLPVNGVSYLDYFSYGSSDIGYNVSAPSSAYPGSTGSELAYMYYVNLANQANYTPAGGFTGCSPACLSNVGPFTNLATYQYWSGTEYTGTYYSGSYAWTLDTQDGYHGAYTKIWENYAWAVRDGDVAAIPEPATEILLLAGLALLISKVARQRLS